MGIYRPSELIQFLRSIGREPKKSLSQNFLIDGNIINKIIQVSHINQESSVIEIGSGPGALTEALLKTGAQVVAVETDRILAEALVRFNTFEKPLTIITADALQVSFAELIAPFKEKKSLTVIGNLPYHIATPLISRFITLRNQVKQMIVMVQEEMAERMQAAPGTPHCSSLSVFLHFYTQVSYEFKVNRTCFYPIPKVDSAIVKLEIKKRLPFIDETQFFQMTRMAFEHRRKTLRASLKHLYSSQKIENALTYLHLSPLARPEELSMDQWINFYNQLTAQI